jgi:protein SCO1/2
VIGGMLRILVVGLIVLVAAMMLLRRAGEIVPAVEVATVLDEPRTLPAVALTDDQGEPFAIGDLAGRYSLVFFGFTNCPDVCPLTLSLLAQVRADVAARAPQLTPRVLFVSVDPNRDTPERITAYLNGFDSEFLGVTASDAELEPLLAALGVAVEKHMHGGANYNVVHNSAIYILDSNARWLAVSTGPHDPQVVASDYLRIRQRHSGG